MDLEQFYAQARESIEQALNQLQTATLLVAQLETEISETGRSVQNISRTIETFVIAQRQQSSASDNSQTNE